MYVALAGVAQWIVSLQTKMSLVQFPVRAHAWVAAGLQFGGMWEATNQCISHTWMFHSLSPSFPFPLPKNKYNL